MTSPNRFQWQSILATGPWTLVIVGFLALAVSFTARASLGLVMPLWETDLAWSRSFVSFGGALSLVVLAVLAPFAGAWIDRRGSRVLLTAGLIALGAGMIVIAYMDSKIMFLVGYAGISALGFATVANHVVATSVARAFSNNQGLATGIATAGSTAGQLILLPFLALLLETTDWRFSFVLLAALALMLALLTHAYLPASRVMAEKQRDGNHSAAEDLTTRLRFLLRNKVFHLLFWSFAICGFTTTGVIETHLLPYAAFCGFPPLQSATAYGVLSGVNMGGMILAGWLTDRMHRPLLLGTIYMARAASFIFLLLVVDDIELLFIFAVIFGVFDYSTVPVTVSLAASHLGKSVLGLAMGLISAGHALGAAVGAFLGGYFFDLFARYDEVWLASIFIASLAGLLIYILPETRSSKTEPLQPLPATS